MFRKWCNCKNTLISPNSQTFSQKYLFSPLIFFTLLSFLCVFWVLKITNPIYFWTFVPIINRIDKMTHELNKHFNSYKEGLDLEFLWRYCIEHGEKRLMERGETLEEAGEPSRWVAYVERGCFKYMVHNDEEGKDYCTGFVFEGEFVAATVNCSNDVHKWCRCSRWKTSPHSSTSHLHISAKYVKKSRLSRKTLEIYQTSLRVTPSAPN